MWELQVRIYNCQTVTAIEVVRMTAFHTRVLTDL